MTIGAAQTLTNYYRVLPGKRVAVVGIDPLSLTVARELTMAGAEVVGIFLPPADLFSKEKGDPQYTLGYLSGMADLAPNTFLRAGAKLAGVTALRKFAAALYPKAGIPVLGVKLKLRQRVSSIHGDDRVTGVEIEDVDRNGRPTGRSRFVEVDCVCLSAGLYPVQELTAGCSNERIDELGGHVPLHSPEMETSLRNLFVAGNITGIEGAKIAMAQGTLAGCAAAARLGLLDATAVMLAAGLVGQARETSPITFQPDILQGRRRATEAWGRTARRSAHDDGRCGGDRCRGDRCLDSLPPGRTGAPRRARGEKRAWIRCVRFLRQSHLSPVQTARNPHGARLGQPSHV
jgi:sarcosine oxidase subunit alpha